MNRPAAGSPPTRVGLPRPTATAWGLSLLGLGLLGAAVNTGNNLLYLMFGLLVAALPVSMAVSLVNLSNLNVNVRVPPAPRAGVPFRLELRVHNRRRRLTARSLRLVVITRRGHHGPALIESVLPGETVHVPVVLRDVRRGPQQLLGVRVVTTFPLGFLRRRRFYPTLDDLLVMPNPARDTGNEPTASGENGAAGRTVRAEGIEYEGLRRGRDQDDARRVDWKATARSGTLMVRETSGEGRPVVYLAINTARPDGPPARARVAFETEVSRLAGRGRAALVAGGVVHLAVKNSERTFTGLGGWSGLQRVLARLVPTDRHGRPLPPIPLARGATGSASASHVRDLPPGRAHRRSALAALAISGAALFAYGGIGPVAFFLLALALGAVLFTRLPELLQRPGFRLAWRAAAVGALAFYALDLLVWRHNALSASLALIVFITLYKLFNSHSLSDDRQMLLVSLLQMVLAAALTTGLSFVLPLLSWLLVVTHAQIAWTALPAAAGDAARPARLMSHVGRLRYGLPATVLSVLLLAVGGVVFFVVPHLGTGAFSPGELRGTSTTGFSETTRLGDIGRIKLNHAKVMEVDLSGSVPPGVELKWRGLALDQFDGRTWERSDTELGWTTADAEGVFDTRNVGREVGQEAVPAARTTALRQQVRLEPGSGRVLFALPTPKTVQSSDLNFLAHDSAGSLLFPRPLRRRIGYQVTSQLPRNNPAELRAATGPESSRTLQRYLELPPIDGRIRALARQITDGATTRYDQAARIEAWVSSNHRYSLNVNDLGRTNPLTAFLFEDMPGHCEYFATSMVVLARSAGVPARYVAGYLRGEKSRFGQRFTVRQSDAHAWVEIHFAGIGWVAFDPTPPAGRGDWQEQGLFNLAVDAYSTAARWWDDYVIGIDLDDQARGFLALRDMLGGGMASLGLLTRVGHLVWLLPAVVLALSLLSRRGGAFEPSTWWPRGWPSRRGSGVPVFYRRLLRLLARRGLTRRSGETPAEFAARVARRLPGGTGRRLGDLTDLYYRVRFDSSVDERDGRLLGERLLADIRQDLRTIGFRAAPH